MEIKNHLHKFHATNPVLVEETQLAKIFRVTLRDQRTAIVKSWINPQSEQTGVDYLLGQNGVGCVQILGRCEGAILMEQLDGPSLTSVVAGMDDQSATEILIGVAQQLQSVPNQNTSKLTPLKDYTGALFSAEFAHECNPELEADIRKCRVLAMDLFESASEPVALHGDLHHDNILKHQNAWLAIDAKGIFGDPAYEFANALRNPRGHDALIRDPNTIGCRAEAYATAAKIPEIRMLSWGAVKTALSICWRSNGVVKNDAEADLLSLFLDLRNQ